MRWDGDLGLENQLQQTKDGVAYLVSVGRPLRAGLQLVKALDDAVDRGDIPYADDLLLFALKQLPLDSLVNVAGCAWYYRDLLSNWTTFLEQCQALAKETVGSPHADYLQKLI